MTEKEAVAEVRSTVATRARYRSRVPVPGYPTETPSPARLSSTARVLMRHRGGGFGPRAGGDRLQPEALHGEQLDAVVRQPVRPPKSHHLGRVAAQRLHLLHRRGLLVVRNPFGSPRPAAWVCVESMVVYDDARLEPLRRRTQLALLAGSLGGSAITARRRTVCSGACCDTHTQRFAPHAARRAARAQEPCRGSASAAGRSAHSVAGTLTAHTRDELPGLTFCAVQTRRSVQRRVANMTGS